MAVGEGKPRRSTRWKPRQKPGQKRTGPDQPTDRWTNHQRTAAATAAAGAVKERRQTFTETSSANGTVGRRSVCWLAPSHPRQTPNKTELDRRPSGVVVSKSIGLSVRTAQKSDAEATFWSPTGDRAAPRAP